MSAGRPGTAPRGTRIVNAVRAISLNRFLGRNRALAGALAVAIALGAGSLTLNEATCGCNDDACSVCLSATATVATLVAFGRRAATLPQPYKRIAHALADPLPASQWSALPGARARAGPPLVAVLRL